MLRKSFFSDHSVVAMCGVGVAGALCVLSIPTRYCCTLTISMTPSWTCGPLVPRICI